MEKIIPNWKELAMTISIETITLYIMRLKSVLNTTLVVGFFVLTFVLYDWFIETTYFVTLEAWAKQNFFQYFVLLTLVKIISIVWPPLPGGVFTIASIPFIGWFPAYLTDFLGSMIGSSFAYIIGKRYGYTFLRKLFGESEVQKLNGIKVKKGKEFEAIFVSRLTLGHSLLELICYGAGLLGVSYSKFILASIAVHTVTLVPTFYLIDGVLEHHNMWGVIGSSFLGFVILYALRKRYFEKKTV